MQRSRVASAAFFLLVFAITIVPDSQSQDDTIARVPNPPINLSNLPRDLREISPPKPTSLSKYVKDTTAAIQLGKALFWDMQVGSDGVQACASCHFRAGADPRSKNQVSPGLKKFPTPDTTFNAAAGANYQLRSEDFPFRRLSDPRDRSSAPIYDVDDAVSSQGVHFLTWDEANARFTKDPEGFQVGGVNTRRVEPRNTPSVINAVFNHRNFWDGRAEETFNGVNHVGDRDPNARVVNVRNPSAPSLVIVRLDNSSLASQAVAPIVSSLEMARPGRTSLDVAAELARGPRATARRVGKLRPLAKQKVHKQDSVLGKLSRWPLPGVTSSNYDEMVKAAFKGEWWNSNKFVRVNSDGSVSFVDAAQDPDNTYSVLEYNFALFFGIAVQMYEATLIADDTPWDRFRREHPSEKDAALNPWTNTNPSHISRLALFGAHLFNDRTRSNTNLRCSNCHEENELTDASVRRVNLAANGAVRNRDGNIIDKGFNNIGVRPTSDDLGAGATDVFGQISRTRRLFANDAPASFDGALVTKGFGVQGSFKVPSLRNVALTAPYFHNGGASTLRQVLEFYSRGGDLFPLVTVEGVTIEPLGVPVISEAEMNALEAFLQALTDERVVYQRAPFDHPQLLVPNGHPGNQFSVTNDGKGLATDEFVEIPEVGAQGGAPIPGFLEGPFGPK